MRIVVCVKQVPNTKEVRLDPKTNNLIREGIPLIMNPYDLEALEMALAVKDESQAFVSVLSMGPPQAEECLRDALAMGADEAYLLSDPKFRGADTLATSFTLAAAIRKMGDFDLVLCGQQAIDGDTGQVGPELAEFLGIPQITGVESLAFDGPKLLVGRRLEEETLMLETSCPVLLTVARTGRDIRIPTVWGRLGSSRKDIIVWTAGDLNLKEDEVGLAGSATRVVRVFMPEYKRKRQVRQEPVQESARWLAEILKEKMGDRGR